MATVAWRRGADDGSVWTADPEPAYHLAAWSDDGWRHGVWHVLDAAGNVLARSGGETLSNEGITRVRAEEAYRALVARALHK